MTIPESINLLGVKIPVIWWEEHERSKKQLTYHGEASFTHKTIHLAKTYGGENLSQNLKEHAFFHELLHQALDSAGYQESNNDEQFVDVVSGLLHQALGPHMQ